MEQKENEPYRKKALKRILRSNARYEQIEQTNTQQHKMHSQFTTTSTTTGEHVVTSELGSNKQYYRVSCIHCRNSHRKCDRELPGCSTCVKKGIDCCYVPPKKRGRNNVVSDNNSSEEDEPLAKQSRIQQLNNVVATTTTIATTSSIPQIIPFSLEDRINSAAWCATRALFFLHAPPFKSHPQHLRHMCNEVSRRVSVVSPGIDIGDLYNLTQTMSRLELQQSAMDMFNKAKQLLLHPEVFPSISNNVSLAHSCSSLATFLLTSRKQNIHEAMLFNSAVKVFVKDTKSVADSEHPHSITSLMSTENGKKMVQYRESVQIVSMGFYGVKFLFFLHSDITKYTMSDLEQNFNLLLKISNYVLSISPIEDIRKRQSIIHIWKSIIEFMRNYTGIVRLRLVLDSLEILATDLNMVQPKSLGILISRSIQLYAITIELKTIIDLTEREQVKALQRQYANMITILVTEDSITSDFITNGSRLLVHICEIHMEHCDKLILSEDIESRDYMALSEALTFLQSDVVIMNRFQNAPLPIYEGIVQKLNSKIISLLTVMQHAYKDKQQQQVEQKTNGECLLLSQLLSIDNQPVAPDSPTKETSIDQNHIHHHQHLFVDIDDFLKFE
jgi:hypothetical protein